MNEPSDMHYSKEVLKSYISTLDALRVLNLPLANRFPEDGKIISKLAKEKISKIREAFSSRDFLREYGDCDISQEILCEFEDFLGGKIKTLKNLDEKIRHAGNSLESLRYLH